MRVNSLPRPEADQSSRFRTRRTFALVIVGVASALMIASMFRQDDDGSRLLIVAAAWAMTIAFAVSSRRIVPPGTQGFTALDPALALALLFGVALPIHNVLAGPPIDARGAVSTGPQAYEALTVSYGFFVTVLLGWVLVRPRAVNLRLSVAWAPPSLTRLMLTLGGLGTGLRYVSRSQLQDAVATQGAGLGDLMGTVLAPLLPVGAFLTICRPGTSTSARVIGTVLLVPPSVYGLSTYGLNRAVFVVPAVAMFVVLVRAGRVRRVTASAVALAVLAAVVFLAIGQVRLDALREEHGPYVEEVGSAELARTSLQVYGQSPYLTGVALGPSGTVGYSLRTPLYSILSPVPRLGESYRARNGTRLFNTALGRGQANDQIIPVWLEMYLSGGLWLMAVTGLTVGLALKVLDNVMRCAWRSISVYAAALASLWLAQSLIVSLLVLAQIFVYFVLPLMLLTAFEARRKIEEDSPRPLTSLC